MIVKDRDMLRAERQPHLACAEPTHFLCSTTRDHIPSEPCTCRTYSSAQCRGCV